MSEIMRFRGILPPEGRAATPPPSTASPGGLILNALYPLRDELTAALARDDREYALQITYRALSRVTDALATVRGDRLTSDQVRVHGLMLDLTPLPLVSQLDGTVCEGGTLVHISYRNWSVSRAEANLWAQALAERFQIVWPGAWIFVAS